MLLPLLPHVPSFQSTRSPSYSLLDTAAPVHSTHPDTTNDDDSAADAAKAQVSTLGSLLHTVVLHMDRRAPAAWKLEMAGDSSGAAETCPLLLTSILLMKPPFASDVPVPVVIDAASIIT